MAGACPRHLILSESVGATSGRSINVNIDINKINTVLLSSNQYAVDAD